MPTAQVLKDRTDFYSFVSSIGAYTKLTIPNAEENQPLRLADSGYGGDKARCEAQLTELMGKGRMGIVRPCPISGPRDPSLSFHYWLSRLKFGHRIVAPGDGNDPVELVDVRDVGNWVVANVEAVRPGPYNTCGQSIPFAKFLADCRSAVGGEAEVVWVDRAFLEKERVGTTNGNMPFWNPDDHEFMQVSSAKARQAGWTTRSLSVTAQDAWRSYADRVNSLLRYPQSQWGYSWGISEEHESQVLKDWGTNHK